MSDRRVRQALSPRGLVRAHGVVAQRSVPRQPAGPTVKRPPGRARTARSSSVPGRSCFVTCGRRARNPWGPSPGGG